VGTNDGRGKGTVARFGIVGLYFFNPERTMPQ
jgi:hypothetical protein